MPCIRRDGVASEPEEVDDVPGDDGPIFTRGVLELAAVLQLAASNLAGARRVYTPLPKEEGIEVGLHRAKRTSSGYCISIASGVSAAFASIWA